MDIQFDSVVYERMDAEITAIKIKLGHNKSADILPRSWSAT